MRLSVAAQRYRFLNRRAAASAIAVVAAAALLGAVGVAPALAVPAASAPTARVAAVAANDRIASGAELLSGAEIRSTTGSHRLVMQADGNAVVYAGSTSVWSTKTAGHAGARLRMGADGALAVVAASGSVVWSNGIRSTGARLVLKPDGRLYEIAPAGNSVWVTPTPPASAPVPAPIPASDRLQSGKDLLSGAAIGTGTGSHRLVMQSDGNAVLFAGTVTLWSSRTAGNAGARLRMGTDGALTVIASGGAVLWSNNIRSAGARLVVKPDGRLYEIATSGSAAWFTAAPRVIAPSYLAAASPYVLPDSTAAVAARTARSQGRINDAVLLEKAASQGGARWFTTEQSVETVEGKVRTYVQAARAAGRTPVLVTYAIPNRDCGSQSAGGFTPEVYFAWSAAVARGLSGAKAVVIVEPDAIKHVYDCGHPADRFDQLKRVSAGYVGAGAEVYLDGGTNYSFGQGPNSLADIAARLSAAGVGQVAGFATNVSNFHATADERTYANKLSDVLGGAHYIIDTSRNGNGSLKDATGSVWCNPPGRALGDRPGATNDGAHVANLWVKTVGLSDGTCNGGPAAGQYWEAYLLGLAANAHW